MESEVSIPLEEAINTTQGIEELRSISGAGTAIVVATFNLQRDIDAATQDVRDRVAAALPRLPREMDPPVVRKFDNDSSPVLTVALSADRSIRELTELADKTVRPRVERAAGVGDVEIVGGLERAIDVRIDVDRLAAYRIPITAVRTALQRQNAEIPGGNVDAGRRELSLRTLGRFVDARAFSDLVVATVNGSPVRLADIGTVEDGTKEQRSASRLNGVPTVTLEVRRQSGANTMAVIAAAKKGLARAQELLPTDVKLLVVQDQSRYIENALHEINIHLILGSILASLVVLLFMRNTRSTLIAAVAIPTSIVATFGIMRAFGFTLNSVTMLALVLMVGIVIDDAIVVLENIFRFMEEKSMGAFEAARAATADIGLAVLATTFSLVVIFLPVSFMSSISGRFLYQFGITASAAILVSLLVSFTLTPMMSARLLEGPRAPRGGSGRRSGFPHRLLPLDRRALRAPPPPDHGPPQDGGPARRGRRLVVVPGLSLRAPGVHPRQRRRGRVRGDGHRPRGHERRLHGRGHARGREGDSRGAGRDHGAHLPGRVLPGPGQRGRRLRAPSSPTRSACSASAASGTRPRTSRPGGPSTATTARAT